MTPAELSLAAPFAALQEKSLLQKLVESYSIVHLACFSFLVGFASVPLLDLLNLRVKPCVVNVCVSAYELMPNQVR